MNSKPVLRIQTVIFKSRNTAKIAYLDYMRSDKIVQFVSFETSLPRELFIKQWELYSRSVNSDADVTLQQTEKKGVFKYMAQHRCASGEFQFLFSKAGRSSRVPEVEIKAKQAGGYSMLQEERMTDTTSGESKIFAFIVPAVTDLQPYKQLTAHAALNIYEAYFENCQYAFVLEYFVKNNNITALTELLKALSPSEIGVYTECELHIA